MTSKHDEEQRRLIANWNTEPDFRCVGCGETVGLPRGLHIVGEYRAGGFRADVAALDVVTGGLVGTLEVIDTNEPSARVLAAQEALEFALFRYLPKAPAAQRVLRSKMLEAQVTGKKPPKRRGDLSRGAWLCSVECLRWWQEWGGYDRCSQWGAPRCDGCGHYLHMNALSDSPFHSWGYDPNSTYCIHCAARLTAVAPDAQWRTPGETMSPTPSPDGLGPASLLLAYSDAAFWAMVWRKRVDQIGDAYGGHRHPQAEAATAQGLLEVGRAFDDGDWERGATGLFPIGAPGWQEFEDEPQRLLAFREDNCRGVALCWSRLLRYRLEQLPTELQECVRDAQEMAQAEASA